MKSGFATEDTENTEENLKREKKLLDLFKVATSHFSLREKMAEGQMRGNNSAIYPAFPPHPSPLPHGEGTKTILAVN